MKNVVKNEAKADIKPKIEEKVTIINNGQGDIRLEIRYMKEAKRYIKFHQRDKDLLIEIFYGNLVPVHVISSLYFPGQESYRAKRMSTFKIKGLISLVPYCKVSEDSITRTIGYMYRLTEYGMQLLEQFLNRKVYQGKKPPSEKIEQYWHIGYYRLLAHELGVQWQYSRQIRGQVFVNNNTYISAMIGDICLYMVGQKPKDLIKHLKSSINRMTEIGCKTHIIICPDNVVRKQFIIDVLDMEYNEKQTVYLHEQDITLYIKTIDDAVDCMKRLLKGEGPYDMLKHSLSVEGGAEIIEIENRKAATPYMAKINNELYFLSGFCDYNIIEFLKVCKYEAKTYVKGNWPGEVLMHVKNATQLSDIASILERGCEPECSVRYILQEAHDGSNHYLIENGKLIPVRGD